MIKNRNSVQHRRRAGKWPPFTGLAEQAPRPAGHFRSRLALESAEDKKRHTESGFAGKRKVAGGLENYCKKIRTNEDTTGAMQLFGDKVDL